MLMRSVANKEAKTKEELMQHIWEFWDNELTTEACNALIDHVYKVVPVVQEIEGRATRDIPDKLFTESAHGKSMEYFDAKLRTPEVQRLLQTLV
jgi:hypothetical protein